MKYCQIFKNKLTRLFWKDMQPIRITLQALFQNKETGYVEKF